MERAALEGVATWAGCYTPGIALAPPADGPAGLLLEVSGSLKLFQGIAAIASGLARGASDLGFTASVASAPTAQGAWLLARSGCSSPCLNLDDLAQRLQPLPVEALECDARALATLEALGVRTVGEVLALPRAGLARRIGPGLRLELDRALGTVPDPRTWFVPPERFHAALELPAEVREAEALVFATRRLIVQFGGFLAARDCGVQRFRIELSHKETCSSLDIGLVRPSRDAERFALLVREKLASLRLVEPVRRIALTAEDILVLAHENLDLLEDTRRDPGALPGKAGPLIERLRERLCARLGEGAVDGIASHADHRPEAAWRVTEPGERSAAYDLGARPLWLLHTPERLQERGAAPYYNGALALLAGPERIESGWWDGRDAVRDYFIARAATESLLWIYRERGLQGKHWYLHGIFG